MNELKCLEHPTLKVPYEVFNKRYRNAQRVLDVEARQVASASGEIDTATKNTAVTTGEIDTLLGGMVEKLTTMKRKASEAINEELQAAYVCKKRLEHLKEQATVLNEPSTPQTRVSAPMHRDYFLRNGYYESANKLADARSLRELTNVDIYAAAAEVEAELCQQRTARCLQWCADNKSKLRKLNSSMEFKIRIQLTQCYKESTKVSACPVCQPPLNRLARALPHAHCSHSRLVCRITNQPLNEHNQPMVLPNGQVYGEKRPDWSLMPATLNRLERALPHAHCSTSRLVYRITKQPINEHNQPMVLPNGQVYGEKVNGKKINVFSRLPTAQVYGEKAIKEMVKLGSIVCPKTKEVFSLKSVEKVYVM
ncbi:unnamed protein product [Chilo suppressalis]|uniref:E3 ubiquitin-protein transferase MAEA n=1 Tax=Chilo suppressalis TaxID=168631 RepID=A0ABN8B5L8_CHISP|nr:unnamed protein product [Chilo suppressalis]